MMANAEKDPMSKIRAGMAGANNSVGRYATLNIIEKSDEARIESQRQEFEKSAARELIDVYSVRISRRR